MDAMTAEFLGAWARVLGRQVAELRDPGALEDIQRELEAYGSPEPSKECRLCGAVTERNFVQSKVDRVWFCTTCVREVRAFDAGAPEEGG